MVHIASVSVCWSDMNLIIVLVLDVCVVAIVVPSMLFFGVRQTQMDLQFFNGVLFPPFNMFSLFQYVDGVINMDHCF